MDVGSWHPGRDLGHVEGADEGVGIGDAPVQPLGTPRANEPHDAAQQTFDDDLWDDPGGAESADGGVEFDEPETAAGEPGAERVEDEAVPVASVRAFDDL